MKTLNKNKGAFGVVLLVIAALVLAAAVYYVMTSNTALDPVDNGSATTTLQPGQGANTTVQQGVEQQVLGSTDWTWLRTELAGGTRMDAPAGRFVLSFASDGTVRSTTDCNSLAGSFVVDGNQLSFGPFTSTLMFCEGSKETDYSSQLSKTQSYLISGQGTELRLNTSDGSVMVFSAKIGL
jgi:heat shock protein HslJ